MLGISPFKPSISVLRSFSIDRERLERWRSDLPSVPLPCRLPSLDASLTLLMMCRWARNRGLLPQIQAHSSPPRPSEPQFCQHLLQKWSQLIEIYPSFRYLIRLQYLQIEVKPERTAPLHLVPPEASPLQVVKLGKKAHRYSQPLGEKVHRSPPPCPQPQQDRLNTRSKIRS